MEKKPIIPEKNSDNVCAKRNLNEFNVMSTQWGICLSSTRIDEKSNEIPEMQEVISQLDCRGCIVTADSNEYPKRNSPGNRKESTWVLLPCIERKQKTHIMNLNFAHE